MATDKKRDGRPVRVRAVRKDRPDIRAIARVVIALAMAESAKVPEKPAASSKQEGAA